MKRLAFLLSYLLGLPALLRYIHRNSLTIVLYHGVAPARDQGIYNYRGKFIVPETFARQLAYLSRAYTILPLEEALSKMSSGTLPQNSLVITFDDGYKNFYEYALPLLKKVVAPATIYIATDFVVRRIPLWVDRLEHAIGLGDGTPDEKIQTDSKTRDTFKKLTPAQREHDLRNVEQISWTKFDDFEDERAVYAPLSLAELRSLPAANITIGAHTRTHPILAKQTDAEQTDEIRGSYDDLVENGVEVSRVFAYPNGQAGDWNEATERILQEQGFTHALTTLEGWNTRTTHPYRLHRFALDATEDMATFANVVSGVRLFLRSLI